MLVGDVTVRGINENEGNGAIKEWKPHGAGKWTKSLSMKCVLKDFERNFRIHI